jgi:UDP-N-acetylglucosamine--N-acetylmuramyl-(pentapeptide) pyrophosphoryl-undecaprenol N-acetylglucosamine transferase
MKTRFLIMAGGTGGHVFPALAVARELAARGCEIRWLGTRTGMEAELVARAGFPIEFISIAGLRGKGVLGWFAAPFRLVRALWQAIRILRAFRPAAVLGMGGFVTGPGGVAAKLLGIPLLIHEQNAIAGLTNRLLARIADRVMEAFPGTFRHAVPTGNPVRADIAALPPPAQRYSEHRGPIRVFVVGGSLGAMALNQTVPQALAKMEPAQRPAVRHQTGQRNLEAAGQRYREAGVDAELLPFVDDMAAAYAWADLVLCRAGALTVSELAAAGVPAVLVPFPFAVDDHQTHNAQFLVNDHAGILVPQENLTPANLAELLREFCAEPDEGRRRLGTMAEAARRLARPEATRQVADLCLAVATGNEQ